MQEKLLDFIKGLMQPALTVVAVILFASMSLGGQFAADDVFKVLVGIFLFWFGYTGIKNFTFTGKAGKDVGNGQPPKVTSGQSSSTVVSEPVVTPSAVDEPEPQPKIPAQIFTEADDKAEVPDEVRQEIGDWYFRVKEFPPQLPQVAAPSDALGAFDYAHKVQVAYTEAGNQLIAQAADIFPESERDNVIGSLPDCNWKTWHQINQHWAKARKVWIDYGMAYWKWYNGYK